MRLRRGLASATPALYGAASAYDADAQAYFARMASQEPAPFKDAVNAFVLGLKSDGVWSKLDRIGLFATSVEANALYDLRSASKSFTGQNTTTWTAERGIAGDGSTGYIDFGERLDAAGNQYAQDSASQGVWCNASDNVGTATVPHLGGVSSSRSFLYARVGAESGRVNSTTTDSSLRSMATRVGHRSASRTGASLVRYFIDGGSMVERTTASAAPLAVNAALGRDGSSFSNDRFAACWSGGGLADAEVANLHSRLNTLLTALGAN